MKKCDLCSSDVSHTTHIPIDEFKRAVRDGFNPFTIQGIDTSAATGPAGMFGVGKEQVYRDWRSNVLSDTTDWGLCSTCLAAYRKATRRKKWWQFWK